MKSLVNSLVAAGLCCGALTACQQVDGNSLLTNQITEPSTHALDKTPKSEELYLKPYSPTLQATGTTKLEVAGECYISTYPTHNIVALEGGVQLDIVDLNPASSATSKSASCQNGRFTFALNTSVLTAGTHTIRFVLQAWDENKALVVNDVQGAATVTLTK